MIIRNTEDETRLATDQILNNTEQTLLAKIQEVNAALKTESDPERLAAYGNALKTWLDTIDSVRKLRLHNT